MILVRLIPCALEALTAFCASVDTERLWKAAGLEHSDARAALGLEIGSDQTLLREMDKDAAK